MKKIMILAMLFAFSAQAESFKAGDKVMINPPGVLGGPARYVTTVLSFNPTDSQILTEMNQKWVHTAYVNKLAKVMGDLKIGDKIRVNTPGFSSSYVTTIVGINPADEQVLEEAYGQWVHMDYITKIISQ